MSKTYSYESGNQPYYQKNLKIHPGGYHVYYNRVSVITRNTKQSQPDIEETWVPNCLIYPVDPYLIGINNRSVTVVSPKKLIQLVKEDPALDWSKEPTEWQLDDFIECGTACKTETALSSQLSIVQIIAILLSVVIVINIIVIVLSVKYIRDKKTMTQQSFDTLVGTQNDIKTIDSNTYQ
jgi:hypothetical protein